MSALRPPARLALLAAVLAAAPLAWADDPTPGRSPQLAWDAGPGARLLVRAVPGVAPIASGSLPEVDPAQLPQGRVVLRRGVNRGPSGPEHQGLSIYGVCLRAPGAQLSADIDETAFDKLDARLQEELKRTGGRVDAFAPGSQQEVGLLSVRPYTGEASAPNARPGVRNRLQGKHLLGFLGDGPEVIICTLACLEASTEGSQVCGPVVASATLEAALVPAPRPGFVSRLSFAAVRRPAALIGVVVGLLMALAGVAIAAWPQRRVAR